jgi:hypothetical protein
MPRIGESVKVKCQNKYCGKNNVTEFGWYGPLRTKRLAISQDARNVSHH